MIPVIKNKRDWEENSSNFKMSPAKIPIAKQPITLTKKVPKGKRQLIV